MFFFQNFCHTYAPCRHQSFTFSVTEGNLGSKPKFFFKIFLSVTGFFSCSQLRESSQRPQLWYQFVFKVNFGEDFLPSNVFLSVASSEALIQRCSLMKYGISIGRFSFETAVLNIFGKFLDNISDRAHVQHSYELSIYALFVNDFLGISRKFSKQLFQRTQMAGRF